VKALLVSEFRHGRLLDTTYELLAFAEKMGAEAALVLVGTPDAVPAFDGTVYLADVSTFGEFDPETHKHLVLSAVVTEDPDYIVCHHSSYGWDLAPRLSASLEVALISEIVSLADYGFEVGCCGGKMRRTVKPLTGRAVLTIQSGAFPPTPPPRGIPSIVSIEAAAVGLTEFLGYEPAVPKDVDLTKADVIVSAGRGIGKPENVALVASLAAALHGELGASRPVVDAGWVDASRQVGTTGQTVAPKLYIACGISGAIQHLAGMRQSGFTVAINKDRDAPIGGMADVLVVADLADLVPALVERL
jgi:electron transfer flavoprotein alpha subunit